MNPKDLEVVTASEKTKRPGREADIACLLFDLFNVQFKNGWVIHIKINKIWNKTNGHYYNIHKGLRRQVVFRAVKNTYSFRKSIRYMDSWTLKAQEKEIRKPKILKWIRFLYII